jgi:hypothetical protein
MPSCGILRNVLRVLVTANVVLSSPILVTLMMEEIPSSETLALIRVTQRNVSEDDILHIHPRENLKLYIALTCWALWRSCNVSPVRYRLDFYISEDGIIHSHRRESLKFYILFISVSGTLFC